jgi:predicted permease
MKRLFWRRRRDADLDEEIEGHLRRAIRDRLERGETAGQAESSARREFGNIALITETTREMWGWASWERLAQDVRYGVRLLRRSPGFTFVAVVSLALGIGANTTIFTVLNAVLVRPLPYPDPDRLTILFERVVQKDHDVSVHPFNFVEWQQRARSFDALALIQPRPVNAQGEQGTEQLPGVWFTSELFRVFGVAPALGRAFTAEETSPGDHPVVIISHELWRSRFGSDPGVIGRRLVISERAHEIVGVAPAGLRIASLEPAVYLPLPLDPHKPDAVGSRSFMCFGRLKPGVSLESARADMTSIGDDLSRLYPLDRGFGVSMFRLHDYLVKDSRLILFVLMAVVASVLLIACGNVASLLLTRGLARRHELAIRASLGASRLRIVRQLVVESLLLSSLAGAAGLLVGTWTTRVLLGLSKTALTFAPVDEIGLDAHVLTFTLAVSSATAVLFGLLPAWEASRADVRHALGSSGRTGTADRKHHRLRNALVVGEVSIAVVLLVGAGLFLRTFSSLVHVDPGFDPRSVLTMRLFLPNPSAAKRADFVEELLQRVETLPGVRAAGTIQFLPIGSTSGTGFNFQGDQDITPANSLPTNGALISRGYVAAMGIPVLAGRSFGPQDRLGSPRVVIVNESFVKKYSPSRNVLGRTITVLWSNQAPTEIIGVVGDVRYDGLTTDPAPTVYLPHAQTPGYIMHLVVRTPGSAAPLVTAIRRLVGQLDPTQAITAVKPMEDYLSEEMARPRLYASLVGAFAALALLLASIGLYGLVAYIVGQRTHEIGIRVALGAQRISVLRMVMQQGVQLVLAGLVIGLAGALLLGRVVSTLLFGVTATDPLTYAVVSLVLVTVALAAAAIPARRAALLDPTVALRCE